MTLKDCTKEEPIFVVKRLQILGAAGEYFIRRALCDVEDRRERRKHEEMRHLTELSAAKDREYRELLAPYEGQRLVDIPNEVLQKAGEAQNECRAARLKWFKLAGIKIRE